MAEPLFTCNICKDGKVYTSIEANEHKKETKHNKWIMEEKEYMSHKPDCKCWKCVRYYKFGRGK